MLQLSKSSALLCICGLEPLTWLSNFVSKSSCHSPPLKLRTVPSPSLCQPPRLAKVWGPEFIKGGENKEYNLSPLCIILVNTLLTNILTRLLYVSLRYNADITWSYLLICNLAYVYIYITLYWIQQICWSIQWIFLRASPTGMRGLDKQMFDYISF